MQEQMEDFRVYVGLIYFCFSFWASATKAFGVIPFNVIQLDQEAVCRPDVSDRRGGNVALVQFVRVGPNS